MNYLILNKCTDKLLLSAKMNPENNYYIYSTNLSEEDPKLNLNGTNYILPNIYFGEPQEVSLKGILWDENNLSIDDVDKLNEYLELDKPAYLGNLYCDELEQLLEYDPFLGNSSCKVPENIGNNTDIALLVRQGSILIIDYIDKLRELGYKILTLGDYQKLVPESDILVYKPTKDLETDFNNIHKILTSEKMAFIGSINEVDLDEYNATLLDKLISSCIFSSKICLTIYYELLFSNLKLDLSTYKYALFCNRLPRETSYGQKIQLISDAKYILDNCYKTSADPVLYGHYARCAIDIPDEDLAEEFITETSKSYQFSRKQRINRENISNKTD